MTKYICLIFLFILLITTGCSKKAGQVVIYTSMEENRNKALKEQLAEKFPDKDIVVQYLSTGNSAAKIKNEGTNVEADIVLDLETAHMVELEENFADLSSFDTSIYLDGVNKSNRYLTWTKYTMSLVIDKNYFDKHNLSVLSTKTEVSEYISSTLKVPLNATEIFTSKSVSILFICSSPIMILNPPTQKKKMIIKTKIVLLSMQQLSLRHSPTSLNIRKITIESKYHY